MTNEEALEVLELHLSVSHNESERKAVQIAIEALKWQSKFNQVVDDVLTSHRYARELSLDAYSKYDEGWTDACLEIKSRRSDEK